RFLVLKGRDDLPALCVQRVPEPKHGKVRIHLDLGAPDLAEATTRIEALGGSWDGEDRILEGVEWRTFADPEGHEFDILRLRPSCDRRDESVRCGEGRGMVLRTATPVGVCTCGELCEAFWSRLRRW